MTSHKIADVIFYFLKAIPGWKVDALYIYGVPSDINAEIYFNKSGFFFQYKYIEGDTDWSERFGYIDFYDKIFITEIPAWELYCYLDKVARDAMKVKLFNK